MFAWSNLELPFHCVFLFHIVWFRLSPGKLCEQVGHEICICLCYFRAQNPIYASTYISAHTLSPGGVATLPSSCAIPLPVPETTRNACWLTLPGKCQSIRFQIQRVSAQQLLFCALTSEILLSSAAQSTPAVAQYSIFQFNLQSKLITHLLNTHMKSRQLQKQHSHAKSVREAAKSPHLFRTVHLFL